MDALKAIIVGFSFFDSDIKNIYDKLKSEYKSVNIIFVNPTWILLVEIIGKYSGISVIRADMMFSTMIEKRVLS